MSQPDLVLLHAPSVYDFRKHSILYGPVSDLVPSTPVFELYPIGFTTMAEYLERHGFQVRIANLAVRMFNEPRFDAEKFVGKLKPLAFGIDFHWAAARAGSDRRWPAWSSGFIPAFPSSWAAFPPLTSTKS